MDDQTQISVTEFDVKEPGLLLRVLRKIVDRIKRLSDRLGKVEAAPPPPTPADLRAALEARGTAPLNVTGLLGILGQPQHAGAPRYSTPPADQVLQQLQDTQLILVGSGPYDLYTVVGGNPSSLSKLISGLNGSGIVSSVGLSLPAQFTVTGSPVTSTGTLTAAWASELVNTVFAAPSGGAGTPAFRLLAASDISPLLLRTNMAADAKGWSFLGSARGAATTVGPVTWIGSSFQQLMIKYIITGYNGGTPVGRVLFGAGAVSTTALTNGSNLQETATGAAYVNATSAPSIPGCPLAVTLSAIRRSGTIMVDGETGSFKSYEIVGQNGNQSVSTPPSRFHATGFFSDLSTNAALLQAQLTVYDTLVATAPSAQAFLAGTYIAVWGRNTD